MLQLTLSLLESGRAIHAEVHDGLADVAMAALSGEPETFDELCAAMARYVEPQVVEYVRGRMREGVGGRSAVDGQMVIDLAARLLINGVPGTETHRLGVVLRCDEESVGDIWLPYRIPDEWHITAETRGWQELAGRRRRERLESPAIDCRAVLYGKVAETLVSRWLAIAGPADDAVEEVQSWWLLTPRADLRNKSPRDWLLAKRPFIDGDVEDQARSWTLLGQCPPGLSHASAAYRLGGFGSQEIILYHEMVSVLLIECAKRMPPRRAVDVKDAVRHLEQLQQDWLHQPQEDFYGQSPAALIARERARLPLVVPAGHSPEHDDCPICRMMADGDRPMIWQLDNYLLDRSYATSFYESRDEWDEAQREWERLSKHQELPPVAHDTTDRTGDEASRVWSCTHTNMRFMTDLPPEEAVTVMTFAIGGHMGELFQDLRAGEDGERFVSTLHLQFDDVRRMVKENREPWLLRSAIGAYVETLHEIAERRSDLGAKCDDLESKLEFLADQYARRSGQDQGAAY